jgi:hypothetical protein
LVISGEPSRADEQLRSEMRGTGGCAY